MTITYLRQQARQFLHQLEDEIDFERLDRHARQTEKRQNQEFLENFLAFLEEDEEDRDE